MAQDERLVMNHLAKCGGSFIKTVLFESVPGTRLQVEDEAESVTNSDLRRNSFIIGLIRNPFDYYVSLWSYTSDPSHCCFKKAMTRDEQAELLGRQNPLGSTPKDRKRFKEWLFAMNNPDLGTESLRFYGSYLYNWGVQHSLVPSRWHYLASREAEVNTSVRDVNEALSNFNLTRPHQGPVDCWIHTEDLSEGLSRCLALFEDDIGQRVVDWESFNRSVVTSEENSAPHVPCDAFYDEEALAFVSTADRHIIRAFGYPNHCSKN